MAGSQMNEMVNPQAVQEEDGWNVRVDSPELQAHIRWLADSIKTEGLKIPLVVVEREGTLVLRDGHCRLKAIRLAIAEGANITEVPVLHENRGATETDMVLNMYLRSGGKPLTVLEQGMLFQRLRGLGLAVDEIATRSGVSTVHVSNALTLCKAPEEVVGMVKEQKVSASLAIEVVKADGEGAPQTLSKAFEIAQQEGKSHATKKHVEKFANLAASGAIEAEPAPPRKPERGGNGGSGGGGQRENMFSGGGNREGAPAKKTFSSFENSDFGFSFSEETDDDKREGPPKGGGKKEGAGSGEKKPKPKAPATNVKFKTEWEKVGPELVEVIQRLLRIVELAGGDQHAAAIDEAKTVLVKVGSKY